MIARFTTLLPFVIYVPAKALARITMTINGGAYEVTYWPPLQAFMSLSAIESDREIALSQIPSLLRPKDLTDSHRSNYRRWGSYGAFGIGANRH
jgi:hypothetical protein